MKSNTQDNDKICRSAHFEKEKKKVAKGVWKDVHLHESNRKCALH